MLRHGAVLFAVLLVSPVLAGCLEGLDPSLDQQNVDDTTGVFDTSRGWSMPLSPALYGILDGVKTLVPSHDGTEISLGYFFPDVPGCDWDAAELPEECRLPVVMDAGPYYGTNVDQDKYRPPIIEWLVPRGYVVVQMSVRGTGESAGCMEFFSENAQRDVDAMVTHVGTAPWSNGNVGMMGRSYDGTTPFMGAMFGNPHLKTIVPISGIQDWDHLMFKNGTSEFRGPIMHNVVYWATYGVGVSPFGTQPDRWDYADQQACEEVVLGTRDGAYTALSGDADTEYWQVRDFGPRILENYEGSVWIVHGLEDWNVNPSQVVPFINDLQDAGIDTRAWLGVWAHAYPDRMDEHRNVRWDWAEETVKWFDFYLKGEGGQPPLDVEVEDNYFVWRSEASYPPRDAVFESIPFTSDGTAVIRADAGTSRTTEPLEEPVRIAGLPQFHATVTPNANVPTYVFAELYDVFPDGRSVRVGWGAIDLRYHAGGNFDPATLVPGMPVVAQMEFEPTDALIPKGHRLRLVVHMDGVEDILASPNPGPVVVDFGASDLRLPLVDRPTVIPSYQPLTVSDEADG